MVVPRYEVIGLRLPLIEGPTDLAKVIVDEANKQIGGLRDGDIIVVTSKLYLKSIGALIDLSSVKPRLLTKLIARICNKNPVETEIVLRNSRRVLAVIPIKGLGKLFARVSRNREVAERLVDSMGSLLLVETKTGLVSLDAGLDYSNIPPGKAIVNNVDFDEAAKSLRERIEALSGKRVGVVITDTESLLVYRGCSIDIAVGASGVPVVAKCFAEPDMYGRPKFGGVDCIADEIAAAAALLMGQTSEGVPVVVVRGLKLPRVDERISMFGTRPRRRFAARMWIKTLIVRVLFALLRK